MIFFGTPFRDSAALTQKEMIHVAQSQHEDHQGERLIINPPAGIPEKLADLVTTFFNSGEKKYTSRIVCFFEQKSSHINAVIGGSVVEVRQRISNPLRC